MAPTSPTMKKGRNQPLGELVARAKTAQEHREDVDQPTPEIPVLVEPKPVAQHILPTEATKADLPYNGYRSLGNQAKFKRAVDILEVMYRFAEDSRLFGSVSIEVSFQNGEANVVRKQLNGTEK